VSQCLWEGTSYDVGDSFPAGDGCNTCTCGATGEVGCTKIACAQTCTYDRQECQVGDTFPAVDGCNTCTCQEGGQIACTDKACLTCSPDDEWWRSYVATDVEECRVIRYVCPEHTTPFANDCGCGCEQAEACAEEIDCFEGGCDPVAEAAACPYSTIDTTRDCSAEAPCPGTDGTACRRPDAPLGCGICFNPPEESTCPDDDACDPGSICEPIRCACSGQRACVPGCTSDVDCGEGLACGDDARCAPRSCAEGRPCPDNFSCVAEQCQRTSCDASASCSGYCVDGACYDQPGECRALPQ